MDFRTFDHTLKDAFESGPALLTISTLEIKEELYMQSAIRVANAEAIPLCLNWDVLTATHQIEAKNSQQNRIFH